MKNNLYATTLSVTFCAKNIKTCVSFYLLESFKLLSIVFGGHLNSSWSEFCAAFSVDRPLFPALALGILNQPLFPALHSAPYFPNSGLILLSEHPHSGCRTQDLFSTQGYSSTTPLNLVLFFY